MESHNPNTRFTALWALVWLGYPDRTFLIIQLKEAISNHKVPEIVYRCIRKLAPLELLPEMLLQLAEIPTKPESESTNWDRKCVEILYPLADIAAAHPESAQEIWNAISARGDEMFHILCFWGGIADVIDTADIPMYILSRLEVSIPPITEKFTLHKPQLSLISKAW